MREADATTRERIRETLAAEPRTPSALAATFGVSVATVLDHLGHVDRSLDGEERSLLAMPPTCEDCGFDDFDDLLNVPSRCPACKSESVAEPVFRID